MSSGSSIARAYVEIIPSMEGSQQAITKGLNVEQTGESEGKKLGSSLSSSLIKAFTSVVSVATVAKYTKKLVSTVIENTGDFEQLTGSIEKIFDNMDTSVIMEDANNAYKTLNLSANDYLDTITSIGGAFSTTMGDEEGYNTAKKGLQAIADYASGTGDSVSELSDKYKLITRATSSYQSIADQFSKIGLPQTKEAFLETAQSAGYLSDEYTSLTDVPLAEYQQAVTNVIYDCIDSMNLIGNTAEESSNTLSGSINSTKAAWENFTTALGTDDVDLLSSSLDGLEESLFGVEGEGGLVNNVLNTMGNLCKNLGKTISDKVQNVIDNLPDTLENARVKIKDWINNGGLDKLVDDVCKLLSSEDDIKVVDAITDFVCKSIEDFANDPEAADKLVEAFITLFLSLQKSRQELSTALLSSLIQIVVTTFENLPKMLDSKWLSGFFGIGGFVGANSGTGKDIENWFSNLWNTVKEKTKSIWNSIKSFLSSIWDSIKSKIETVWNGIKTFLSTIFTAIYSVVQTIFNPIKEFFTVMWNNVKVVTTTVWEVLSTWLAYIFNAIKTKVESVFNPIKTFIINTFTTIKSNIITIWDAIVSKISTVINNIKTTVTNVFNSIKSTVSSIWNSIKTAISGPLESAKSTVSSIVSSIKSAVSGPFNALKSTVSSIWNGIKSAITGPLESAKSTISRIISSIKSMFSGTTLKFNLKLPHITVSGGVSPYGIAGKGSLPKFHVSWYDKGYDEAQILKSATIFGITNGGQLLGGGESGNEVVVGEQHLLDMIAKTQRENTVGGTIVINVYGAEGQDEEQIAEKVIDKLTQITNNRRVVYA